MDTRTSPLGVIARARQAPFVLLGSIVQLRATTIPILTPGDSTAVVRVEGVLRAPEVMGDLSGAEVTVELESPAEVGQRLLLFAEGLMYGESVAVRETGRTDPEAAEEVRDQLVRDLEEMPVRRLIERARGADVIVRGVVRELRPIDRPGEWVPPSEHDPDWWIALIAVTGVVKGRVPRQRRLEAIFANSRDVQWFTAPKPNPGQEGVFLLRRERRFDAPKGALALLDPDDLQPPEYFEEIGRLLTETS